MDLPDPKLPEGCLQYGDERTDDPRGSGLPPDPGMDPEERSMDEIVVMLGTNDLLERSTAEETAIRMKTFLRKLMEDNEPSSILLLAPPVFRSGEWVEGEAMIEESRRLGPLYEKLAEELKIRFADTGLWGIEVLYDGVHFSPEGHQVFAKQLDKLL